MDATGPDARMARETTTIARHTAIYTVGTVLRNLASFLMLPIYTRYLTPSDYGVIELLSMVIDLFTIVFGLRVGDAVFRYYSASEDPRAKNQVITTAIALVGGLTVLGLLLAVSFADTLSLLVFKTTGHSGQIAMFALVLPLAALTEVAFLYLRAEGRPWLFVGFSTVRLLFQLGLNIYFVVMQQMHVEGVIYSAIGANAAMAALLLTFTTRRTGFSVSLATAGALARFSAPLILAALATFYLTFADRYLLQLYTDTAEVGIYSLGYKFGFLLLVFAWTPFASVWDAQRYSIVKQADAATQFNTLFTLISAALITSALTIGIFVRDLLMVMSAEAFWRARDIVPIVLLAYVFQAWTSFNNLGIMLSGRTIQVALATIVACIFMTILCLILIPRIGAPGAAFGVLAGFVVRFLYVYVVSTRHYDMQLRWGKVLKMALLALAVYAVSLLSPDDVIASVAVHTLEVAIFLALLVTLPIFTPAERARVVDMLKTRRAARAALSGALPAKRSAVPGTGR